MLVKIRATSYMIKTVNTYTLSHPIRSTLNSWNYKNLPIQRDYSESPEKPLPFSKSKAASLSGQPSFSRNATHDDTPWYQPFSISLSLGAILLWFCVLREENDVDKELSKSLYDRVEGLEKKQLELALQQSDASSVDTMAIQRRLQEMESSKR